MKIIRFNQARLLVFFIPALAYNSLVFGLGFFLSPWYWLEAYAIFWFAAPLMSFGLLGYLRWRHGLFAHLKPKLSYILESVLATLVNYGIGFFLMAQIYWFFREP